VNILLSSYVHWWNAEAAYAAAVGEVLRDAGHRVWMLAREGTHNAEMLRTRGLEVRTEFPLWRDHPGVLRRALKDLAAFQSREGIDLVNVFRSREMPLHLWAAGKGSGIALVRTRGSARPIKGHWLNRRLYHRHCGGLIASSEAVRREMIESLRLPPARVRTIHYPVEHPPQPPSPGAEDERRALLTELGLPPESIVLGIVGRARKEKGHERLLRALALLAPRHPDLALLVLDKRYDDPPACRENIQALQSQLGLDGRVRWLGFREDVRRIMGLMHVGVVPSLTSEMNCRVAMEFFSVGVPVVALPTGALPEVIEHGINGLVAPSHSPEDLADTLAPLLADPARRQTLAQGALGAAAGKFSRPRFLAQTLAAYKAAMG